MGDGQAVRDIILSMKGIEIAFPGVKALNKVDFSLAKGEVHALLGENGAGKSTLIKCLTGVNHKDAGTITYKGREINPSSPQEAIELGISTVFQEINLCQNLSVSENIFIGRQPMRAGRVFWKEINRRASEILERFDVHIDVTRPLQHYSTAIQQIVSIARAVDIKADVLILDEPTSSLDENEVERLFGVVRELKRAGMGIIFITHFLDQVFEISDRITVLRNGNLVGEYAADEITKLELVTAMIGKDMIKIFDLKPPTVAEGADVMLAADRLGAPGAIDEISLTVKKGEMIGFAGLLGSGRTETAQLLFGVVKPTHGHMTLRGQVTSVKSPSDAIGKKMAFCPEDRKRDGIIGDLTVRVQVAQAPVGVPVARPEVALEVVVGHLVARRPRVELVVPARLEVRPVVTDVAATVAIRRDDDVALVALAVDDDRFAGAVRTSHASPPRAVRRWNREPQVQPVCSAAVASNPPETS